MIYEGDFLFCKNCKKTFPIYFLQLMESPSGKRRNISQTPYQQGANNLQ
jgi:hypothetical protein